ncbi:MAG TPA: hypothetical protein EYH02_01230 [Ignisphaera aggregans]|uniref:Uncharacterized protein n=1 Tax=Ignisphaera aggregans TaxID=334771 RepID=A0A832YS36_9CREN|nr:hypothetical protein [Ignisphaera aggregans]
MEVRAVKQLRGMKEIVTSWIESKLKEKGFEVKRDVLVEGEGVRHLIDIIAELRPLPNVTITLGVIVLDKEVKIEDVEKLMGWKEELPLTKLVIVPLRGVDSYAHTLAVKHGIDIAMLPEDVVREIGLGKVFTRSLLCRHIEPVVSVDKILGKISEKIRPSIFRRSKGYVERIALMFIPLIESRVELVKSSTVTGEVEVVEGSAVFDGIHGYIVSSRDNVIDIRKEYGSFAEVPFEAIEIIKVLSEEQTVELGTLAGRVGMDVDKLRPLLEVLASRGLVDIYGDLVEFKGLNLDLFVNVDNLVTRYGAVVHEGEPVVNETRFKMELRVPISRLEELLMSMRAKVIDMKITYYPLYIALIAETKNETVHEKVVVYDALSGKEVEGLSSVLAEPGVIDRLKELKGFARRTKR